MFKVNNNNTSSCVAIVNFEYISLFSSISFIDTQQVNVSWEGTFAKIII